MNIFVVLSLIFLSWCFHFFWTRRRLYWLSWNVPGPLNLPLIGYAYITLKGRYLDVARKVLNILDTYPNLCKIWLGPDLVYFTSKAEHAKIILNTKVHEKIYFMKFLAKTLGDGLLVLPADSWKRHRKIIAPSLHQNVLNTYPETISKHCLVLLENLEKCVGKGEIDPCKYITNCAMDIVGETMCGVSLNTQKNGDDYSKLVETSLEIIFLRMFRFLYHFDWIFARSSDYKTLTNCENKIRNLATQCRQQLRDEGSKPFMNLIISKLRTNELTEKEIDDEIFTFLVTGSDTNASSECTLLTLLAIHQDIQQKVYEEVMEVVGSDTTIDLETFNKLDYTKRVINESLRIRATTPFIGRYLEDDIVLDGTVVPKGAHIAIGIFYILRNEEYWPEPLKFDPDRFLPENSVNRHPYAWIPFSAGPRNCIGFKSALMTMRIMTALIIRKFKVTTTVKCIDDLEYGVNVIAKPVKGYRLSFELR